MKNRENTIELSDDEIELIFTAVSFINSRLLYDIEMCNAHAGNADFDPNYYRLLFTKQEKYQALFDYFKGLTDA